jgi:hypothetical protein
MGNFNDQTKISTRRRNRRNYSRHTLPDRELFLSKAMTEFASEGPGLQNVTAERALGIDNISLINTLMNTDVDCSKMEESVVHNDHFFRLADSNLTYCMNNISDDSQDHDFISDSGYSSDGSQKSQAEQRKRDIIRDRIKLNFSNNSKINTGETINMGVHPLWK